MNAPTASIIMPVYNAEPFLAATIASVLRQTVKDFELILIDDGSSDESVLIARGMRDARIHVIQHTRNQGVAAATNTGYAAAKGDYIVPMDHDDLAMPRRLECQLSFLAKHPELDGCGAGHITLSPCALLDTWRARMKSLAGHAIPPGQVACEALWGGILFNPTLCFRSKTLRRADHWWDTRLSAGADDEFYGRLIASGVKFCVLPDVVLRYRRHAGNLSRHSKTRTLATRAANSLAGLARLIPEATDAQKELHTAITTRDRGILTPERLPEIASFLREILQANTRSAGLDEEALKSVIARHWSRVCAIAGCKNLSAAFRAYYGFNEVRRYLRSPFFLLYQWQKRCLGRLSGLR